MARQHSSIDVIYVYFTILYDNDNLQWLFGGCRFLLIVLWAETLNWRNTSHKLIDSPNLKESPETIYTTHCRGL